MACLLLGAAWLGAASYAAEPPAVGTPVSFLACPIARDTGPDTDLCFFATFDGHDYALVNPPDWSSPQLKHRVLVEGRVKAGPAVCGAIPIEGRASVITAELDDSCNVIVPFDGVIKGAAGGVFNSGSPQQKAYAQDLAARAALDPSLSIVPAILDPPAAPMATPPFEVRRLVITYPFGSTRGPGPDMVKLKELASYALVSHAPRVEVTGYRASSRLSNGTEITEPVGLGRARAVKVRDILIGLGIDRKVLKLSDEDGFIPGKGDEDWHNRKVEVAVTPGA